MQRTAFTGRLLIGVAAAAAMALGLAACGGDAGEPVEAGGASATDEQAASPEASTPERTAPVTFSGSATFSDPDDGDSYKGTDWESSGIAVSFVLSQDGTTVSNLAIDVSFGMNVGGLSADNSGRIVYSEAIPVDDGKFTVQVDDPSGLCDLDVAIDGDRAEGTVSFTYRYSL
ncbi:MAG: hypothetical protein LBK95_11360, partial [Bifidobacteriaceae bacterium]|nr:hypothetical protein [Bifidobacteriaceae bacterium]